MPRTEQQKKRRKKKKIRRIINFISRTAILCIVIAAVAGVVFFAINDSDEQKTNDIQSGKVDTLQTSETENQNQDLPQETESENEAENVMQEEEAIPEEPEPEEDPKYTTVVYTEADIKKGLLILVNNQYAYEFPEEAPDFVNVYEVKSSNYKIRDTDIYFDAVAMENFDALLNDFYAATGIKDVIITSCFRDYATQSRIMQNRINSVGEEKARLFVANPGNSEHHTGLAVDIGIYTDEGDSFDFRGEGEYGYINENCYKYGFIVRYSADKTDYTGIADEPWHFRYTGAPHAEIMTKYGLCMEEYISFVKAFSADGTQFTYSTYDGSAYNIYYVPSQGETTEVPVPFSGEYTVSGNNVDGFIVTAKIQ